MSDGKVDREDVIKVLRENGISVERDKSHSRDMYIINRQDQLIECIEFPQQFRRRLVQTLARKCQIAVNKFYFRERGEQ